MDIYSEYLKFLVSSQMDERLRCRVSASDIVQESFYEAHRDFAAFRGKSPPEFVAWMRRIVVNNLIRVVEQNLQAAKRDMRREVALEHIERGVADSSRRFSALLSSDDSPSGELLRQETHSSLAEVLARLPEDYRRVIRLRNVEGLSFNDVARRMNRSCGAARMLWLRALEQIRNEYIGRSDE